MNGQQSLVEIENTTLISFLAGFALGGLLFTSFGSKVRGKAQSSIERKLGL